MTLPTFVTIISTYIIAYFVFQKHLQSNITIPEIDTTHTIKDKIGGIFALIIFILCIIGLTISSLYNIESWWISLPCAGIVLCRDIYGNNIQK
jgi:Na+/H+ antiporter NhaD/arsenite permease-like protein